MPDSRRQKTQPTWRDVKARLTNFERDKLVSLISDLYAASSDNRAFLHTRFALCDDPLKAYKDKVSRWVYPDVFKHQDVSVAKAKKAISQYTKATGDQAGTLELMAYFVERGNQFTVDFGDIDEGFYSSLESMFGGILETLKRSDHEVIARRYQPVMRFLASTARTGEYIVQRMTYRGEGGWSYPLAHGSLARLVRDFVPPVGTERFFELL